jgi:hypothetical protein
MQVYRVSIKAIPEMRCGGITITSDAEEMPLPVYGLNWFQS